MRGSISRVHDRRSDFVDELLKVYAAGAFPMADARTGEIGFYTADPRALMPLDERFHVPRSVERELRRGRFMFRTDRAFADVVRGCAAPRAGADPDDAWLDGTLASWVCALCDAGHAHSLEAWAMDEHGNEALVGGIYGVSIGAAFFGESMFHRARPCRADGSRDPLDGTGASSACLVTLQRHLRACGYTLFDVQISNAHTQRFGLIEAPREVYTKRLRAATGVADAWRPFVPGA